MKKRLAALEIVTQSKEGRFIARRILFLIYQVPQTRFMIGENTTKMVFRKGTWQQGEAWHGRGQDRMQRGWLGSSDSPAMAKTSS